MMKLKKIAVFSLLTFLGSNAAFAQCANWNDSPNKSEAEDAHSVYRQALKTEDYKIAQEYWQVAYDLAPAADGARDYHMMDGVKIYMNLLANEADAAKKAEYKEKIVGFYNQAIGCYEAKGITVKCDSGDMDSCYNAKIAYLKGRKGYDMYYYLNSPYSENYQVLMDAMEAGGNDSEYIILDPLAKITVYQFQKGLLDKATALANFERMEAIAEHNIANNAEFGEAFGQAWASAKSQYTPVENDVFDCEYFKAKYIPQYEENPGDMEQIKTFIVLLKRRGCADNDPFLSKLESQWGTYASTLNAERQAEFEANNPAMMAKSLYDEGNYAAAIAKYDEAIRAEADPDKKASMLFSKASIQFRKLKSYSTARATAKEAAASKANFGRPYMLIGDMYATSARNCGDSWNQRLAIIAAMEKYAYAKSIDPSVADEADEKISKYRASLPTKEEAFMRNVKAGDSATVGCWIGETVKVKFN